MLLLLLIVFLPSLVWADAVVCEVTATPGKLSRFIPAIDLSRFVAGTTETCNPVPEAQTPAQIDLYNTVPPLYIKTVGAPPALLMAEMDVGEKQAVNDARLAAQQEQQTYVNEATGATCKYASLDEVNTKSAAFRANMDSVINGIAGTPASVQAALHTLMDRVVMNMGVNLARCDLAHVKARQ